MCKIRRHSNSIQDENADAGYSLQPIVFGVEDNIVFLKISKDMKVHKR